MTAAAAAPPRIVTLDIVRGVAVMGILAMNIVAFSMPFPAYLNPAAYGTGTEADYLAWLLGFIFVDGKMRGLFSLLFGASMLLVIERAEAKGESAASVHFRRMAWLLLFGLIHLYLIWYGDILARYALVGMIAWLFRDRSPGSLIGLGVALTVVQLVIFIAMAVSADSLQAAAASPQATEAIVQQWENLRRGFEIVSADQLADDLTLFRGSYGEILQDRLANYGSSPLTGLEMFGWETLSYVLFGMAALKSGFITGEWPDRLYARIAAIGFAVTIPAFAVLAFILDSGGFSVPLLIAAGMAAPVPLRPVMVLAFAALIIVATRRGGWLVDRIAAAGRAAFTNYLGTSIVMTAIFYGYGLGLYGTLGRAELWLVVIAAWAAMLAWSKPWLDRFAYGPFEWLWRSLARWELQPMLRRGASA